MGGGSSRHYIVEEQLKPVNASDIPDGDFKAAKREVERLRLLISRVDSDMLEKLEKSSSRVVGPIDAWKPSAAASSSSASSGVRSPAKAVGMTGCEKTSLLESEEGREYWDTVGKPLRLERSRQEEVEHGAGRGSMLESAAGATCWRVSSSEEASPGKGKKQSRAVDEDGYVLVPQMSAEESNKVDLMNKLLTDIRSQIFSKTRTMEEAFLEMDADKSGYISRTEFRSCMSMMGYFITDEEFDLINKTYPHHEKLGEEDKGISYLEFVTMLTGKLTYVPGFGEQVNISEVDRARALFVQEASGERGRVEHVELWHSYLTEKREREHQIHDIFSKRVFEEFYSMKEAFSSIDKDKSGFIEPFELRSVLLTALNIEASDDDILDLMDKFDANQDGKLSYHEFVKLLQMDDAVYDI